MINQKLIQKNWTNDETKTNTAKLNKSREKKIS